MNDILFYAEANKLNSTIGNYFFAFGAIVMIAYCIFNAKNYHLSIKKVIPFAIIAYVIIVLWNFILYWVESGFQKFGGNNLVRIFIWVPVFIYPMCKLAKLDFRTMCDYLAPMICVHHAASHAGCMFRGCCYGYPWENGIYNHVLRYNTFPIQIIEAIVAAVIVLILWLREKKNGFKVTGEEYPLMLILFGYSRFLLEFLRDNPKLFLGISSLAIHALIMGLVGTAWYITVRERNRRKQRRKVH